MIGIVTEWTLKNGSGHYKRMRGLVRTERSARIFVFTDLPDAALSAAFGDPIPAGITVTRRWADIRAFLSELPADASICVDLREIPSGLTAVLADRPRVFYYDCPRIHPGQTGVILDPYGIGYRPSPRPGLLRLFEPEVLLADSLFGRISPPGPRSRDILVTFGSTDPFGLTRRILPLLVRIPEEQFTVILPLTAEEIPAVPAHIRCVRFGADFPRRLRSSALVLTAFGTTLYEVLSAHRRVFLIDPTVYHRRVSSFVRARGIPGILHKDLSESSLRSGLAAARSLSTSVLDSLSGDIRLGPGRMLGILRSRMPAGCSSLSVCPVCGSTRIRPLARSFSSALDRCSCCRTNIRHTPDKLKAKGSYDRRYFASVYRQQYGRSYLEDRERINLFNRERLAVLKGLLKGKFEPSVLDLGCAMGFFLDSARKEGFRTEGVEIIPQAADYARRKLKLRVSRSDLLSFRSEKRLFDAVTLWYVLEHLPDPSAVFARAADLLAPGGVLGLSAPHSSGFTCLFNRRLWLFQRPADHFFDFSPAGLGRLGKRYGLRPVRTVWRGIHLSRLREAFPALRKLPESPFFNAVFLKICRFTGSGDTFEMYFRKVK